MRLKLCLAALLLATTGASAQLGPNPTGARPGNEIGTGQSLPLSNKASNATPGDTRSFIAPRLPTPSVGDDGGPVAFLQAADRAITLGHTGEAQEAIERAESRLLDRSVVRNRADAPDEQPLVSLVGNARRALAAGDRRAAQEMIQRALGRMARR